MTQTTVSQLKARLSAFLATVRKGETVIVCDRKTPIARMVPLSSKADDLDIEEAEGKVPTLRQLRPTPLRRKVSAVALLRADRDQR